MKRPPELPPSKIYEWGKKLIGQGKFRRIKPSSIKIPLPDTIQSTDYSCGTSCVLAVSRYYSLVGPEYEDMFIKYLKRLKNKRLYSEIGTHPHHLIKLIKILRLRHEVPKKMDLKTLRFCLDKRRPVLLMIQALGRHKVYPRQGKIDDGHWVVAIGYDDEGFFFEDPALEAVRGYIYNSDLEKRWIDTGPHKRIYKNYGLVVWKPGRNTEGYHSRALIIQ